MCISNKLPGNAPSPSLGTTLENLDSRGHSSDDRKRSIRHKQLLNACEILGPEWSPSHKYLITPHPNLIRQALLLPPSHR